MGIKFCILSQRLPLLCLLTTAARAAGLGLLAALLDWMLLRWVERFDAGYHLLPFLAAGLGWGLAWGLGWGLAWGLG